MCHTLHKSLTKPPRHGVLKEKRHSCRFRETFEFFCTPILADKKRGSMKMLTAPPSHRVFTLQEIQKHRRCVISVTPCEASNASGAWGVRTKQSRAAGTTHLLPAALAAQWNGFASLSNPESRIPNKNSVSLWLRERISARECAHVPRKRSESASPSVLR